MRSSTSNSDSAGEVRPKLPPAHRAPAAPWPSILLVAICATLFLLVGVNRFWSARGHVPSVSDSMGLWTVQRRKLSDDERQWALLGTSRMKLGFSEQVFNDHFPNTHPRMLAIAGTHPLASLRDLGRDESFRGTVVLDATVDSLRVARIEDQQPYVENAQNALPHQLIDPWVRGELQSRFPVFQSHLSLVRVIQSLHNTGELPPLVPVVSGLSRFSIGRLKRDSTDAATSPDDGESNARDGEDLTQISPQSQISPKSEQLIREATRSIVRRGGRVVLVHFPTIVADLPRSQRERYKAQWLAMADRVGVPAVHFSDLPNMDDLRCVDGQHLNGDDAVRFTAALLDAIEKL